MIGLEHETNLFAPQSGAFIFIQRAGIDAIEEVASGIGAVQQAQHVHQGGFAGAGRAHHGQVFTLLDAQVDVIQCMHFAVAQNEGLVDAADFNHPVAPP